MIPDAPRDDLFRGLVGSPVELRADSTEPTDDDEGDDGSAATAGATLFGYFTKFNDWTEINSWYEGIFMERTVQGAFTKTIAENLARMVCQFDHGYDMHVGSSPLGPIDVLREDKVGPYYEVPLLDTDYNRDRVLPMLQGRTMDGKLTGSVLGASYRFRVTKEDWSEPDKASSWNPDKLPERTIREVQLYEFGPVVFPAFITATAGVRSLTDHYLERRREARSVRPTAGPAATGTEPADTTKPPPQALDGRQAGLDPTIARARMRLALLS